MGSKVIKEFKLDFRLNLDDYIKKNFSQYQNYKLISRSLDARGSNRGKPPEYLYRIEFTHNTDESQSTQDFEGFPNYSHRINPNSKPIIIGAGPCGLYAALRLSEYGIKGILIERGQKSRERMVKIARYWRYNELDENSNVCYGEGGAGLFSDGKLLTRVKSPHIAYVLKTMVDFGAPEEITYRYDPHVGSNKIRKIISALTETLIQRGWDVRFDQQVEDLLFDKAQHITGVKLSNNEVLPCDFCVLAIGHSAHELMEKLHGHQVAMASKGFAVGVRLEHPREHIDRIQYGTFCENPLLETARYRLSYENKTLQPEKPLGTYSFCMCPGGYVLSSSTHRNSLVVNGMSNYSRHSPWSNSAMVVSTGPFTNDVLEGIKFQRQLEKKFHDYSIQKATGREIPTITMKEFMSQKWDKGQKLPYGSCPSGMVKAPVHELLPEYVTKHLQQAFQEFDSHMKGFIYDNALIYGPETRTSSPITILRSKETLESISHSGLFPGGEGAGYAGGITSAAVDGVKIAEQFILRLK
jgi:uncharacterized FAD-dependent dehydrogenase